MPIALIMAIAGILLMFNPNAEPLTKEQKVLQGTYLGVHAIDWRQTRTIAKNPDRFYEINPLMGKHPSTKEVDAYMAASALLHTGITMSLPSEYRKYWFGGSFAIKLNLINMNVQAGIGMDF